MVKNYCRVGDNKTGIKNVKEKSTISGKRYCTLLDIYPLSGSDFYCRKYHAFRERGLRRVLKKGHLLANLNDLLAQFLNLTLVIFKHGVAGA